MTAKYSFQAKIWKYKGKAAWYFVTLPDRLSKKIRKEYGASEEGWGRLKTSAQLGDSQWETSIWFDTRAERYLLPVKSDVRKKENVHPEATIKIILHFAGKKERKKVSTSKPTMWS